MQAIQISTKCDFINSNDIDSIFYLVCTPDYFFPETKYSLLISEDISIGYDENDIYCQYGGTTVLKTMVMISQAEYDFYIIYDLKIILIWIVIIIIMDLFYLILFLLIIYVVLVILIV